MRFILLPCILLAFPALAETQEEYIENLRMEAERLKMEAETRAMQLRSNPQNFYFYNQGAGNNYAPSNKVTITAAPDGHFYAEGSVNGYSVRFMIDTGASEIILSPQDAFRSGFNVESLKFNSAYAQTANGDVRLESVMLDSFGVGNIKYYKIRAMINETPMPYSLLGMTFLRRLKSYQIQGDRLTLVP